MSAILEALAFAFRIVFRLAVWCAIILGMLLHAAFGNSAGRD
jgi:hypothetical protein